MTEEREAADRAGAAAAVAGMTARAYARAAKAAAVAAAAVLGGSPLTIFSSAEARRLCREADWLAEEARASSARAEYREAEAVRLRAWSEAVESDRQKWRSLRHAI